MIPIIIKLFVGGLIFVAMGYGCDKSNTFAAPGNVTTMPGGAFTLISGPGGKIKATAPKTPIYITGSSVTVNSQTKTVIIRGSGASKRGYDGRNAPPALSCIISDSGIAQAVIYDSTGRNPQPSSLTYIAYLYQGATLLNPNGDEIGIRYDWNAPCIPGTSQIVCPPAEMDGMQSHRQTYEITVLGGYSSHRTANQVRCLITYSSPRWPWGKQVCGVRMPIPVLRSN